MGFTVYYRSSRPVSADESAAIRQATTIANQGRTWLSCEPVHFFPTDGDGYLMGGSKPNFLPHPDDIESAARESALDGTTRDMLDILCQVSLDYGVDWVLSHEHDPAIGFIREGICDESALLQIEAFTDMADIMRECGLV